MESVGTNVWGCDVPVSAPEPLIDPNYCYRDSGGFGVGRYGIAHNITETDAELFLTPWYSPLPTEEAVPYHGG